jgi:hypothetical protein
MAWTKGINKFMRPFYNKRAAKICPRFERDENFFLLKIKASTGI